MLLFSSCFRWSAGALVAYRSDRLERSKCRPIADWGDLLQPQLKGKIAFPSSSRVLLSIALMTLGLGPNTSYSQIESLVLFSPSSTSSSTSSSSDVLKGCEAIKHRMRELREQAIMFSDRDHIRAFTACLLYTSPSPRDRQKSRMPSSA